MTLVTAWTKGSVTVQGEFFNVFFGINTWKSIYYGIFNITKATMPKDKRRQYILWNYKNLLKNYKPEEEFLGDILLFKAEENKSKYQYLGWEKVWYSW